MGERSSPGDAWAARDESSWWPGNGGEMQQQLAEESARSTSTATQQIFSYKMSGGFTNSGESSSPSYDYRMMSGPASRTGEGSLQQQWWYSPATVETNQHSPPSTGQSSPQSQNAQSSSNQRNQSIHQQQSQQQTIQPQQTLQQTQTQTLQQALQQQAQQALQHQTLQEHIQAVQQQHIQNALKQANLPQLQQQPTLQELQQMQQQAWAQQQTLLSQRKMPRGRADNKPRGRMTAYAFFVQTCREEHKKKHPDENVIFAAFSKKCAERWSTMNDKEKQRFHEMAEVDKKRYDQEMQNYVPPKGDKIGRNRKRRLNKDPYAPKRSLSAFFWFCNDERSKVKAANPEYGMGDIAKELGRRWAVCNPAVKSKYEELSEKDKARYDREMTAYKKQPMNQPVIIEKALHLAQHIEDDDY